MNLPDYIKAIGHEAAAQLFDVSKWTVKSWRFRERTPRPDKAREIQRITRAASAWPKSTTTNTTSKYTGWLLWGWLSF